MSDIASTDISDAIREFSNGKPCTQVDDDYVICPYCGQTFGDCWEWVRDAVHEMNCDKCGGRFDYWAEYSAIYITKPIEGEFSGSAQDPG